MNKSVLSEHINRIGLVTLEDFLHQVGASQKMVYEPISALVRERELVLCRFVKGEETLMSKNMFLCLRTVCMQAEHGKNEQEIYDWLSDNETATLEEMQEALPMETAIFENAFAELERTISILPVVAAQRASLAAEDTASSIKERMNLCWTTDSAWLEGTYRSAHLADIGYCISEMKRLFARYFTDQEIAVLLYS